MTQQTHGTALPWAAFALGAAGSLAANLLDALDAVQDVANGYPVDWPELSAALFFATLVPVALLLVVEMLIRSGRDKDGLAAVMWIGAALVALGAAVMSMGHMYKVMVSLGQPPLFAALMPLAVDGLMLVASVALARAGRAASVAEDEAVPAAPEAAPSPVPAPVPVPAPAEAAPAPAPEVVPSVPVQAEDVPEAEVAPAEAPEVVPAEVPSLRKAGDAAEVARKFVRDALDAGRKVTGADVAASVATYGKRTDRWGRLRIAEVKAERDAVHADELAPA